MVLAPKEQEVLALALALENGLAQGPDSQALIMANGNLDRYVDTILQDMSGENGMIGALTPSLINKFSSAQFWILVYLGVQNELNKNQGSLSYTLFSAINTLAEKEPENKAVYIDTPLTPVDITNIVFHTEFDLALALTALENILTYLANIQAEQSKAEEAQNSDIPMVTMPADVAPANN